ncbi:MAG: hypothetical protein HY739_10685 [Desulfobacterales bacterium]|nr:hypothetical protein [Desulfobacterales bacterium]
MAVTIIISADLYFSVKMFGLYKVFDSWLVFWLAFSFVQVLIFALCNHILNIYAFRVSASESSKILLGAKTRCHPPSQGQREKDEEKDKKEE